MASLSRNYVPGAALVKKSDDGIFILQQPKGVEDESVVTPSGGNTPRSLAAHFADIVNVKDYGAAGDGVTDDTEAVSAALASIPDTGATLYFPPGTYLISAAFSIAKPVRICGMATIRQTTTAIEGSFIITGGPVSISGLIFDLAEKGGSDEVNDTAIMLNLGAQDVNIEDCLFTGFVTGIASTTDNVEPFISGINVSHCTFRDYEFGILLDDFIGASITQCRGYDIKRTRTDTSQSSGYKPPHLVYVTDRSGNPKRGLTISDCYEYGNTYSSSIKVRNVTGLTVIGNVSEGCVRGLELEKCYDFVFSGNVVRNKITSADDSISPAFNFRMIGDGVITGNTISTGVITSPLIRVTYNPDDTDQTPCYRLKIADNLVSYQATSDSPTYLMYLNIVKDTIISGNVFHNTTESEPSARSLIYATTSNSIIVKDTAYMGVVPDNSTILHVTADDCDDLRVLRNAALMPLDGNPSSSFTNCTNTYEGGDDVIPVNNRASATGFHVYQNKGIGFSPTSSSGVIVGLALWVADEENTTRSEALRAIYTTSGPRIYSLGDGGNRFASGLQPITDNTAPLGAASYRWTQVYAASSTISTSDEREKTSVAEPDEALMRAWGAVGFKVFQFKDAVEKKGTDEARLHMGVIAQQVIEAFAAEGLDATRYGLLCHDTWEAKEAVLDEDGNVIEPAQEAGDRYGIRYSEALALEAAYQRWKLGKIESKLSALGLALADTEESA